MVTQFKSIFPCLKNTYCQRQYCYDQPGNLKEFTLHFHPPRSSLIF